MKNRRQFLTEAAAAAGVVFTGCNLSAHRAAAQMAVPSSPNPKRRRVTVGGRAVKTIDVHAHVIIPEANALMGVKVDASNKSVMEPARFALMDEWGTDMQVLSINPNWYSVDEATATKVIALNNLRLSDLVAHYPDRFAAFASVALQFPELAATQLEEAVLKYKLRGAAIGGHCNGDELSNPKYDPFWQMAEKLDVVVFSHPQGIPEMDKRLGGNGGLFNVIGNPLETTIFLSHLIFDGTLDRFPKLKILAAHGGGYLPSYIARSDYGCIRYPDACKVAKRKASEYIRQIYVDSMVFTPEALRHLVAEIGAGQVMIGTDFPYAWSTTTVDHILKTPGLSDADKRAILGETAAKLFGIKA